MREQQSQFGVENSRLMHLIELQLIDVEGTLQYILKNGQLQQLHPTIALLTNAFAETQPVFKALHAGHLHQMIERMHNCFGVAYLALKQNAEARAEGRERQESARTEARKSQKGKKEERESEQGLGSSQKQRGNPMGGIALYNQKYQRHLSESQHSPKANHSSPMSLSPDNPTSKEEFRKAIAWELQDTSYLYSEAMQPQEALQLRSRAHNLNTGNFHKELEAITQFFQQSQEEAIEFLQRSKEKASLNAYQETFEDIMRKMKGEKEARIGKFNRKIGEFFNMLRNRTDLSLSHVEERIMNMEEMRATLRPTPLEDQATQTQNEDPKGELVRLRKKIDSDEAMYAHFIEIKQRQLEELTHQNMSLANQIALKEKLIHDLVVKIEENRVKMGSLKQRMKLMGRPLVDVLTARHSRELAQQEEEIVRARERSSSNMKNKNEVEKIQEELFSEQIDSLRRQKKIVKRLKEAKTKVAEGGGLMAATEQFAKRFTQQMMGPPPNLSRIIEVASKENSLKKIEQNQEKQSEKGSKQSQSTTLKGRTVSLPKEKDNQSEKSVKLKPFDRANKRHQTISRVQRMKEDGSERGSNSSDSSRSEVSVAKLVKSKRNILRRGSISGHKLGTGAINGPGKEHKRSSFLANSSVRSNSNNKKVEIKASNALAKKEVLKDQRARSHKNLSGKGTTHVTVLKPPSRSKRMKLESQQVNEWVAAVRASRVEQETQTMTVSQISRKSRISLAGIKEAQKVEFPTGEETNLDWRDSTDTVWKAADKKNSVIEEQSAEGKHRHGGKKGHFRTSTGWSGRRFASEAREDQGEEDEETMIRRLAQQCANIQQFKARIKELHMNSCGHNCPHLRRYLLHFNKYRQKARAELAMHVQHLSQPEAQPPAFPTLSKKRR